MAKTTFSTIQTIPGILRRKVKGISTKQIGFCVTNANGKITINLNEIVHFDTILHNEGNGFNKQTGMFTCPVPGIYFFVLSVLTSRGSSIGVSIIVDGEIKARSYADGSIAYDQGSISTMVRCEAGHNVWTSVYFGSSIYGDYYSSFSGFLLWGDGSS
ncbi:hypothetical protein CHS0354_039711 [Potamilus streckersoni]|uniref:C1q domain-containing protein n=1 Tax=Potamilus streckersoni TaxID=2493646 RepID=A0AAE0VUG2_9BIVA|nr:hypothetical protein CHS0354_039711 [Potamilus streckersoni]